MNDQINGKINNEMNKYTNKYKNELLYLNKIGIEKKNK